jgi:RNA polymerase sigma-70 factor (ECF subfamily)
MPPAASTDLDRWVEAHAADLYRFAVLRLRQRADAEDAVQETLLAAIAGRAPCRGDASERTWLVGILRHKIVDLLRRRSREAPPDSAEPDWWDAQGRWLRPPRAWGDDPHEANEQDELRTIMRGCLAALPARQAQALILRLVDGLDPEPAARALAVSAGNLAVLLHRARLRLRECLERRWFGVPR